jgi:hypothetical protein
VLVLFNQPLKRLSWRVWALTTPFDDDSEGSPIVTATPGSLSFPGIAETITPQNLLFSLPSQELLSASSAAYLCQSKSGSDRRDFGT